MKSRVRKTKKKPKSIMCLSIRGSQQLACYWQTETARTRNVTSLTLSYHRLTILGLARREAQIPVDSRRSDANHLRRRISRGNAGLGRSHERRHRRPLHQLRQVSQAVWGSQLLSVSLSASPSGPTRKSSFLRFSNSVSVCLGRSLERGHSLFPNSAREWLNECMNK